MQNQKRSRFSLLIDFEATGKDPKTAKVIEVGACLVDTLDLEIVSMFSQVVRPANHEPITKDIEEITGISQYLIDTQGISLESTLNLMEDSLAENLQDIEYIVAYNKSYDKELIAAEIDRNELKGSLVYKLKSLPWLCAMREIEDNYNYKSWKLAHLSLDKGVSVDPKELHRAIADVLLMRKMMAATKSVGLIDDMFSFASQAWVYLQAVIPAPWVDGGKGKELAKELGYSWEKAAGDDRLFEKRWVKRVKESKVAGEKDSAPFRVEVLI